MYLGSHLKYHLSEHESFRELHKVRENAKKQFVKTERSLMDRKEKLFKNKDLGQWLSHTPLIELKPRSEELLADKGKAFQFMMSDESQHLEF